MPKRELYPDSLNIGVILDMVIPTARTGLIIKKNWVIELFSEVQQNTLVYDK